MELGVLGRDKPAATGAGGGCSSSGCGGRGDQLANLPEAIRRKVHDHPCYSEEAHHHYARMHVAVASACNIQCHYCNRKYDCTNESRPGVVSEVLTPDQAVKKVMVVAAKIPQMSVLGIAGPGDPLANPERTLSTFRQLSEKAPDIKLCVSTNGLALPEQVDALCEHNIDHVTITINCVDPEVGAKIHPWIFWNNRRIKGLKAARILIEQQQKGLEMLVARGVLVKVNSVMIPGVNDEHLEEVSRVVKAKGAFLHDVMPLIAEPEHGTFFGVMGQRGPTHEELKALQDACAGDMNMMRHCRQCRADADSLLLAEAPLLGGRLRDQGVARRNAGRVDHVRQDHPLGIPQQSHPEQQIRAPTAIVLDLVQATSRRHLRDSPEPDDDRRREPRRGSTSGPHLAQLASWYRWLSQERPGQTMEANAALREVIPGFDVLRLRQAGDAKLLEASNSTCPSSADIRGAMRRASSRPGAPDAADSTTRQRHFCMHAMNGGGDWIRMRAPAEVGTDVAVRARRLLTDYFTGKTEIQRINCLRDAFATLAHDPRSGLATDGSAGDFAAVCVARSRASPVSSPAGRTTISAISGSTWTA